VFRIDLTWKTLVIAGILTGYLLGLGVVIGMVLFYLLNSAVASPLHIVLRDPMPCRQLLVVSTMLFLFACAPEVDPDTGGASTGPSIESSEVLQEILDCARVAGTILVLEGATNTLYSNDHDEAGRATLPASTFKIPHSIVALETRVLEGEDASFPWDGEPRSLAMWDRDMTFREAFHLSCVPCYQEVARRIGVQRMDEGLKRLQYGSMDVDEASLDRFWIEGESRISPREQVEFLLRLHSLQLPIRPETAAIMRHVMIMDEGEGWILRGKTGWAVWNGRDLGWFVGSLETDEGMYFIATRVQPREGLDTGAFLDARTDVSLEALGLLAHLQLTAESNHTARSTSRR